jgi:integrase/recombinase XerD
MEINVLLTVSFEKWLTTLGYAPNTVYLSVHYINDFFFYLKSIDMNSLEQIQTATIEGYHNHLQTRPKKKQAGGLSNNYITSNINALKRFSCYLEQTGKTPLEITVKTTADKETIKTILTPWEVKALYKACGSDGNSELAEVLGIRDKAILSIYYGCGLRRSEGIALDVKDVMIKEKLLFVRGGKGNKERYVPMTETVKEDFENYLCQARETLLNGANTKEEAFLVSYRAKRMESNTVITRVQNLAAKAGINKTVGLHILRHSIATHLLQSGLCLEEVSQFLGHSSLGSTQIYTHIANEM